MKKILTVIAVSVMTAAALPAVAQSPDGGQGGGMGPCYHHGPSAGYGPGPQGGRFRAEDRVNHRVERLTAHLNLSTEQQAQVKTIMQEEDAKLAAAWKETHDRIAAVLNDQQRAQFEQWHAQHGAGGRGMGPGSGSGPGANGSQGSGVGPQNGGFCCKKFQNDTRWYCCQRRVALPDQPRLTVIQSSHRFFYLGYLSLFFTHQTIP